MTEGSVVYRGYEIECGWDGKWTVTRGGDWEKGKWTEREEVHVAETEAAAFIWIDEELRRKEKEKPG